MRTGRYRLTPPHTSSLPLKPARAGSYHLVHHVCMECPTWCEGAHEATHGHLREVFSGPGIGGTAHIDLTQPVGKPVQVRVILEYDDPEHWDPEHPPEPSTSLYTARAARDLAEFVTLGGTVDEFAAALEEAAALADAHQPSGVVVAHVPLPAPTALWDRVVAADATTRPGRRKNPDRPTPQ